MRETNRLITWENTSVEAIFVHKKEKPWRIIEFEPWLIISPDVTMAEGVETEHNQVLLPSEVNKAMLQALWNESKYRKTDERQPMRFGKLLTGLGALAMTPEEIEARPSMKIAIFKLSEGKKR